MMSIESGFSRLRDLTNRRSYVRYFVPPIVVPVLIVVMVLILGALRLVQA